MSRLIVWLKAWRHPRRGVGYNVSCFAFGHDARMADVETGRVRCARCGIPTRSGGGWSLEGELAKVKASTDTTGIPSDAGPQA